MQARPTFLLAHRSHFQISICPSKHRNSLHLPVPMLRLECAAYLVFRTHSHRRETIPQALGTPRSQQQAGFSVNKF